MEKRKNCWVIPTDKPSRLHLWSDNDGTRFELCEIEYSNTRNTQHIYITSDEEKVSEGDYFESNESIFCARPRDEGNFNKVVLTTDQDLIKDGVQAIDDEFLEWFIKNPSCEEVEVVNEIESYKSNRSEKWVYEYKIIIPKEEKTKFDRETQHFINKESKKIIDWTKRNKPNIPKEEPKLTLEFQEVIDFNDKIYKQEALEDIFNIIDDEKCRYSTEEADFWHHYKIGVLDGLKWKQERSYDEDKFNLNNNFEFDNSMLDEKLNNFAIKHNLKQETLEEATKNFLNTKQEFYFKKDSLLWKFLITISQFGAKWQKEQDTKKFSSKMLDTLVEDIKKQQKRSYSEEKLEEKYKRLYEFTRSILLATSSPKDFERNYEIILAEKTIKTFKN